MTGNLWRKISRNCAAEAEALVQNWRCRLYHNTFTLGSSLCRPSVFRSCLCWTVNVCMCNHACRAAWWPFIVDNATPRLHHNADCVATGHAWRRSNRPWQRPITCVTHCRVAIDYPISGYEYDVTYLPRYYKGARRLATSEINIRCVAEAVSHPRHGNMDDWKWVLSHVQIEQPCHWNAYFVASRHIHELRTNQPVCGEVRLCGSAIVWATRREEFGAPSHGPPWSTAELPGRVFGWPGAVVGRGGDR